MDKDKTTGVSTENNTDESAVITSRKIEMKAIAPLRRIKKRLTRDLKPKTKNQ